MLTNIDSTITSSAAQALSPPILPSHMEKTPLICQPGNVSNCTMIEPGAQDRFFAEAAGQCEDSSVEVRAEQLENTASSLSFLIEKNQIIELRAFNVPRGPEATARTLSGYFDGSHVREMVEEALSISDDGRASGVYWTLNPVRPEFLQRRSNHVGLATTGLGAKDEDILRRRWLFVDVDSVRPADVSATDQEKAGADEVAHSIRDWLYRRGWPDPVIADSGNGYHLLYRIDLPVKDDGLVKKVLVELARRFDTDAAEVDCKVANPARLVRLYGTVARKGNDLPARPHRRASILSVPDPVDVVPEDLLRAVAAEAPQPPVQTRPVAVIPQPGSIPKQKALQQARAYLRQVPGAVSGQGGHDHTYSVTCRLFELFGLSPKDAYSVLNEWNDTCEPPWSEAELFHKVEDAYEKVFPNASPPSVGEPAGNSAIVATGGVPTTVGAEVSEEPYKEADDPHRLARLFLSRRYTHESELTLRFWRAEWWRWEAGGYRRVTAEELRAELWADVGEEFDRLNRELLGEPAEGVDGSKGAKSRRPKARRVNSSLVANVLGALGGLTLVRDDVNQPAWLLEHGRGESRSWVAVRNGLLDLDGLLGGGGDVLVASSARWFSPVCLPYDFDPKADCPTWVAFLRKNLEDDQERMDLLQEWFGYCLTPDTSRQKFLMLEGEGSNGKSVVCAALTAMLGEGNVAHVPLEAFGQRFALTQTLGKLANVASEVGELDKAAEGILKSFTSGDRMMFDRKGIAPVEAMPTARLVLATNNRPRFSDRSGGIWRRMLLMPFRVEIQQEERVYGMDKAAWWVKVGELPGIFNWAVDGLRRLRDRGEFTGPQSCRDALDDYKIECNPARMFLTETCRANPDERIKTEELYQDYREWCLNNGYQPMSSRTFGCEVHRVFPTLEKSRLGPRTGRKYVYKGIAYRNPVGSSGGW